MKKKNFIALILGTLGGLLFALGLCMCLLPAWNAFTPGVVVAVIGAVILIIMGICECLLQFKPILEEKALEVENDIADGVFITADAELLSLVWNNLFSNAVKFTPPGGKITVHLHEADGACVVTVADTGCGISREVGAHIFEKFYQGDTSHAEQGNGLGLALVKRIVEIVGGEITVESEVGKGTAFTVKLGSKRRAEI